MKTLLKQYESLIQAIVELFHPLVEVAVHDLEKGKIVALYNNISRRRVGDPSPLKELKVDIKKFPDYFSPYAKENWDGNPLKCTSITLRNQKGKAVGLICINMDVSHFQIFESLLKLKAGAENPVEIYGQCEEQANLVIQEYLEDRRLSLAHLTRAEKSELVQHLYQKGIFNFKNAAPFIAKKLKTSRASIYNYIKKNP